MFVKVTRITLGETIRIGAKQMVLPAELQEYFTDRVSISWDEETRQLLIEPDADGIFPVILRGKQMVINASIIGKLLGIEKGSQLFPYTWNGTQLVAQA